MTFISEYIVSLAGKDLKKVFDNAQLQELSSVKISQNEAVKILKLLTKLVCDGAITDSVYNDRLFQLSSQMLEVIQNKADLAILSCIYYISKYFLKEKELELALKLKSYLMEIKIQLNEGVVKVYYGLFFELHSFYKKHKGDLSLDMKLLVCYGSLEVLSLCGLKYLPTLMSETNLFIRAEGISSLNSVWLEKVLSLTSMISKSLESIVTEQCETVCKFYTQIVCSLVIVIKETSVLQKVLSNLNSFQSSNADYNKVMSFFTTSVKSIVNPKLPLLVLQEQISVLNEFLRCRPNSVVSFACSNLSGIIFCVQAHWLNTQPMSLSIDEFLLVSKIGILLSQCISRNTSVDSKEMSSVDSLRGIIQNVSLGINVIISHVKQNDDDTCEVPENYLKIFDTLLTVQSKCIELLNILKSNGKDLWKDFWKVLAQRFCSLASVLKGKCYYNYATDVYKNFCFAVFTLEQTDKLDNLISPLDYIIKAFKGLSQCLMECSKYREALIALSIAVLLFPDESITLQKQWIIIKRNVLVCENNDVQLYTMFSIGQELNLRVKSMFPYIIERIEENFNKNIYHLLLWELQGYMTDKNGMSSVICEICRILINHPQVSMDYVKCVELVMRGVEVIESSTEFGHIYDIGFKILENLQKGSKKKNWQILSILGNIHFYKFWAEVNVLRKKLQADVNCMEDKFPTKEARSVMKGLIDPSEAEIKSNIVTAYAGLNILKEQELLQILLQAADVWSKILNTDFALTECAEEKLQKVLDNMKITAYTFALYGYFSQSLKIWTVYYFICKSLKNDSEALFGLSHILAYSSYTQDAKLWKEGEKIAGELEQQNLDDKYTKVLLFYCLAKCNSCMLNDQFGVGWQCLEKLNDSSLSTFLGHIGTARKYLLLSKYYIFCSYSSRIPKVFQEDNALGAIGQVFRYLKALNKEKALALENSSFHLLLMETAIWMGDLCLGTKLYREGYSYLKHNLFFSQKLGLASRSSQLVSKLAKFDILCWEVDNLQVKQLGLETTLCLNDTSLISLNCYETFAQEEIIINQKNDFILEKELADMKLLDVPTPKCNVMSSPVLKKSPFKTPFMANHKEDCDCLCCCSSLIQSLVVDACLFQARIHVFRGENEMALSFFEGGLKLCDRFIKIQERRTTQLNREDFNDEKLNFLPLMQELNSSFFKLSMYYKEFLFLCSKSKDDLDIFICPQSKNGHPQELNLHFILEAVDQTFFMVSEINKSPAVEGKVKYLGADETPKKTTNVNESSCAGVKTPIASSVKLNRLPVLHRNEDRKYISNVATPSLKTNLKLRLKEAKNSNKNLEGDMEIVCISSSEEDEKGQQLDVSSVPKRNQNIQKSCAKKEILPSLETQRPIPRKKCSKPTRVLQIYTSPDSDYVESTSNVQSVKKSVKKSTRRKKNPFILE